VKTGKRSRRPRVRPCRRPCDSGGPGGSRRSAGASAPEHGDARAAGRAAGRRPPSLLSSDYPWADPDRSQIASSAPCLAVLGSALGRVVGSALAFGSPPGRL
jgi:hypothetical protein